MRTDPAVIDLGTVNLGTAEPGPAGPEPAAARPNRVQLQRWWPLAALTLVLVASTSAAAVTAPPLTLAFRVPTAQTTAVALTDQTLYVATGTPVSLTVEDPEWSVNAYRLSDGAPLWTATHDETARSSEIGVQVVDGTPLVTGWRLLNAPGRPPLRYDARTTAYQPDTGEVRWTHGGFPEPASDGQVVFDQIDYEGNPPEATGYTTTTVAVDSGRTLWSRGLSLAPPLDQQRARVWARSRDGRYLATLRRDGRLTVRDLTTGAERSRELHQPWNEASLVVVGDTLRISMLKDRKRTLAAYDLYPPAERWTLTDLSPVTSLVPCGPVLCLHTTDGLRALDPVTGEVRWQGDQTWVAAAPAGPPWPDETLRVRLAPEHTGAPNYLVVDAATGHTEHTLGRWQPLDGTTDPYLLTSLRGEGAHHPGHPDYDPGRLWLGRAGPERDGVEVLGSLDGARSCTTGARHVACVTTQQRVEVWHLR